MNKKEKQVFKKRLLEKKEMIVRKLSQIYNESKEIETNIAQDVVDKAESSYTKEFLLSLSAPEREQLALIDEALKRIEASDYGVCQMCRQPVNRKRLEVVPWASYCITCQERQEKERDKEGKVEAV